MSLHRHAAKVDRSQANLVASLRHSGIEVWQIRTPCDLLLRFWCNRHRDYCWQTLEVKTPTRTGKIPKRQDQPRQIEFLAQTNTPIATDYPSALRELNKLHAIGVPFSQIPTTAIA